MEGRGTELALETVVPPCATANHHPVRSLDTHVAFHPEGCWPEVCIWGLFSSVKSHFVQ